MRQYLARPGQECKSELIVGAGSFKEAGWNNSVVQLVKHLEN